MHLDTSAQRCARYPKSKVCFCRQLCWMLRPRLRHENGNLLQMTRCRYQIRHWMLNMVLLMVAIGYWVTKGSPTRCKIEAWCDAYRKSDKMKNSAKDENNYLTKTYVEGCAATVCKGSVGTTRTSVTKYIAYHLYIRNALVSKTCASGDGTAVKRRERCVES